MQHEGKMSTLTAHWEKLPEEKPLVAAVQHLQLCGYRGYRELVAAWLELADRGAEVHEVGRSVEGLPLFALSIGAHTSSMAVIMAGLHAAEWVGVELALALCQQLVVDPPRDRRVVFFPLVNVDGYRAVEDALRRRIRRFRRTNAQGIDLNRNWPTHYQRRHLIARLIPALGHAGSHPRSAPEVDGVCAFLDRATAQGENIDLALSFHSIGRKVLLPYGGRFRSPEALAQLRPWAKGLAGEFAVSYQVIQTSHWAPGILAHGMELDHLHGHFGAHALLLECSMGGVSWREPRGWLEPFVWYNPRDTTPERAAVVPALVELVHRGRNPGPGRAQ
jgi:hypothetical protein